MVKLGGEKWFKWLWTLLVSDGLVCIFQKLLLFKDFPQTPRDQEVVEGIQWAAVLWARMLCWCQRSEESGQTASIWQKDNSNSNNHLYAKHRPWIRYSSRELHCVPNTVLSFSLKVAKMKVKKYWWTQTPQPPRRYTSPQPPLVLLYYCCFVLEWSHSDDF